MNSKSCRLTLWTLMLCAAAPADTPLPALRGAVTVTPPLSAAKGNGIITGRVVYPDGRPAPNVPVLAVMDKPTEVGYYIQSMPPQKNKQTKRFYYFFSAYPPSFENFNLRTATTDQAGRYRITGVTAGRYVILSDKLNGWIKINDWVASGVSVRTTDKATVEAPEMSLTRGAYIIGRVLDADKNRPIPRFFVRSQGPDHPTDANIYNLGQTDENGRFRLHVAPGVQSVAVTGTLISPDSPLETGKYPKRTVPGSWREVAPFKVSVDGGAPQQKSEMTDTASVTVRAGETHTLVFLLHHAKLIFIPDHAPSQKKLR